MWVLCAATAALLAAAAGAETGASAGERPPCSPAASLDITSASRAGGGVLLHEGVHYSPGEYYPDAGDPLRTWGCPCLADKATCVRKCCALGERWRRAGPRVSSGCESAPERFSPPLELRSGAPVMLEEAQLRREGQWRVLVGRPNCPEDKPVRTRASLLSNSIHLTSDGRLYLKTPHVLRSYRLSSVDEYCMDTFVTATDAGNVSVFDALVCFAEDAQEDHIVAMIGMYISCVFVLLTLAVYAALPELRNLHGRVLMAYLSSMFVGFLFLATLQLTIILKKGDLLTKINLPFTFVIYYALLAGFFWLNVMCFDIWWTFSGLRQRIFGAVAAERRRYALYCAYAFGAPALLTALLAALDCTNEDSLPDYVVTPRINQGIFLAGDARLMYFYLPILVLCVGNAGFFVATSLRIARVHAQTAVLTRGDSATTDQFHRDKQRLWLYVKLFALMGVNWVLEVFSALFPHKLWIISDFYNVIVGFTIFVIFICKRKTLHLIKKRYNLARGVSPPRSQTTSTRNTSISREEIVMPPLQPPPSA